MVKYTYLLYENEILQASYGTLELLRLNILVLLIHMLIDKKLNHLSYENMKGYLEITDFEEDTFKIEDFGEELRASGITIQKIKHENDSRIVIENILKHIEERFQNLTEIMHKDVRITATIPGHNPENHSLGPGYFEKWKLVDKKNHEALTKTMYDYISGKIIELVEKFEERVKFGEVHYQNASSLSYQLWSANAMNYNLPEGTKIPGTQQAQEMKIQDAGVYGIVVNPILGYSNI